MRVLLDTHTFLWWVSEHGARVSPLAREIIVDGANEVVMSVVSAWEIAIKVRAGGIDLPAAVEAYIPDRLHHHGFDVLQVGLEHAIRAGSLPMIHRDPFDRMLVAQAQVEDLPILTADPAIGRYDVETIW